MAAHSGGLLTLAMGSPLACATSTPSLCLVNSSVVPLATQLPCLTLAGSRSSLQHTACSQQAVPGPGSA